MEDNFDSFYRNAFDIQRLENMLYLARRPPAAASAEVLEAARLRVECIERSLYTPRLEKPSRRCKSVYDAIDRREVASQPPAAQRQVADLQQPVGVYADDGLTYTRIVNKSTRFSRLKQAPSSINDMEPPRRRGGGSGDGIN